MFKKTKKSARIISECINKAIDNIIEENENKKLNYIVENIVSNNLILVEENKKKNKKKNSPKKKSDSKNKKRSVIKWLQNPEVNTAEIRRRLEGNPKSQKEEDSKRSYFMKKVNQTYNKDFTNKEINDLYSIKTHLGQ